MKSLLKLIFLISLCQNIFSLHFDLNEEHVRCYYEDFYKGSVAVIKYKIWSTPNNLEKGKNIL